MLFRQRGQIDRKRAQRMEAQHGIGVASGADEHPGDRAPHNLAGLPREIPVQLGQTAGKGGTVVPCPVSGSMTNTSEAVNASRCAGRGPPGPRGAGLDGGGSERASKKRVASSRRSATVSSRLTAFSAFSSAAVLPSTWAACSIHRIAVLLSLRLTIRGQTRGGPLHCCKLVRSGFDGSSRIMAGLLGPRAGCP